MIMKLLNSESYRLCGVTLYTFRLVIYAKAATFSVIGCLFSTIDITSVHLID